MFDVLEALSSQLFMPSQVQAEFWRNRDDVIRRVITTSPLSKIREAKNKTIAEIKAWKRRTMSVEDADALANETEELFHKSARSARTTAVRACI
ncbi:hypothetical protein Asi02nite_17810 [Asanoa siamensis]|uniref:PIN like domain-containing protein n=1 Tax=Asanoa siamensis TaxID=926357 RepID=A0ABQ4CMQ2_9ACTN|nr:hypothetical protein Asi02nite_17810 [Asanoa siamensis]